MTQIRRYAPDLILTLILFCLLIIVLIVPIEISYTLSEQKTPNNQMVDFLVEEPDTNQESNKGYSTNMCSGNNNLRSMAKRGFKATKHNN